MNKKILLLTLSLLCMVNAAVCQTCIVKGKVITDHDGEAASFAIVNIPNQELRTVCDVNGRFELRNVPVGKHTIEVECLGYTKLKHTFTTTKNVSLSLQLKSSSFALPEFEVMAKKSRKGKVVIDEAALEYIQPTSLADVMLLLPGSVYKENNLTQFSQISSRQVGSDANTSLGVGIITDGAPVTNDGIRSQLVGITEGSGSYDGEVRSRTGINQGADMRMISTDHIQSVEFTRGISSARYGNLSSGMISISSKHGVTPLRVRLKSDLKNKLIYAGKGWRLGENAGTIHAGIDYLHTIDDIREEMDKFSRMTAQLYYNNKVKIGNYSLDLDGRLSQTVTVSKMKKDELTYEYDESYKADYSRTALMMKGNLTLGKAWLDQLELVVSADYTRDKISRHRMVISGTGPMNLPLAYEEGEHEGIYLPRKYYSDFYIDNQPVNIYAQLNAVSRIHLMKNTMLNLQYGAEYTNVKNHGAGAVIEDETRPPLPYDNSYMRPRPNWAIPALGTGAAYAQADFIYDDNHKNVLQLSIGGRASTLMNLPDDYYLHGYVLTDPRLNISYTIGESLKNTFRVGYGEESKTPTLDYLYPEKLYKDFYMLNAYTVEPQYRHLITYTNIYDVAISSVTKKSCTFSIISQRQLLPTWQGKIHIGVAPTKNISRIEWLVEKATEIGFDSIHFLDCQFSERKNINIERLDKVAVAAMKQSHKSVKPELTSFIDFNDFIRKPFDGNKYIAHCYDEIPRTYLFDELRRQESDDALVLVGPEGDFSIEEVRMAVDAGFISVNLGTSRLRTETAGLSAVMMMQLAKN